MPAAPMIPAPTLARFISPVESMPARPPGQLITPGIHRLGWGACQSRRHQVALVAADQVRALGSRGCHVGCVIDRDTVERGNLGSRRQEGFTRAEKTSISGDRLNNLQ